MVHEMVGRCFKTPDFTDESRPKIPKSEAITTIGERRYGNRYCVPD